MIKPDDVEALKNQAALLAEIAPNLGHWLDYSIEGLRAVDDYFDQRVVDGVIKEGCPFEV